MEYECGQVLLYSKDKIRMMDFLCDVFDFEVDSVFDSVHLGALNLKLLSIDPATNADSFIGNNGIIFSFKVKSELELKEIMSKYNFFLYRKSDSNNLFEKLELSQNDKEKVLTISDIDQRIWRFELPIPTDCL